MPGGLSPAERALLERLQERRQELDARNRDLELRENLIKDAEKRLENRIDELKDVENRINGKGGEQAAKLKSLVIMYEGMKPKDAARIFDKLDQGVLVDVASVMNPRKLADVLALMNAEIGATAHGRAGPAQCRRRARAALQRFAENRSASRRLRRAPRRRKPALRSER